MRGTVEAQGLASMDARPFVRFGGLLLVVSLLGSTLAGPLPGTLQTRPRTPQRINALSLSNVVTLAPVSPGEILGGGKGRALSEGTWRPGGDFDAPHLSTRIIRRLPSIWRMRVRERDGLEAFDVRYELSGPDGAPGLLRLSSGGDSEVRTTIEPLVAEVVQRDVDSAVVEGGALLILDLAGVRSAGRYTGTLTVTVDHF